MRTRRQTAAPAAREAPALGTLGQGTYAYHALWGGGPGCRGWESPEGLRDQGAWLLPKLEFLIPN